MVPVIFRDVTPLKIFLPNEVADDEIDICINDEHSLKAKSLIEDTDDGIKICVNDEHLEKASIPILMLILFQ